MNPEPKSLRLFLAVDFPLSLKESLVRLISSFQDFSLRWTRQENFHLTLKFIGAFPEEQIPSLEEKIFSATSHTKSFPLLLEKLGIFPDIKRPQVLWVGVEKNPSLLQLASQLEEAVIPLGIEKENRPFQAHITLGRTPRKAWGDPKKLAGLLEKLSFHEELLVQEISLFKSELQPEGPVYEVLRKFPLHQ